MSGSFNRLLAFLTLLFCGTLVFFHFHGALFSLAAAASRQLDAAATFVGMSGYQVAVGESGKVDVTRPELPDISALTTENIASRVPDFKPGRVVIRSMAGLPNLREFVKQDGRVQRLRLSQVDVNPNAIVIQEGDYDLTHLYDEVRKLTNEDVLHREGGSYILRMPLLVDSRASLTISDKDTPELRLSQDKTVFIANSGQLFILRTKIVGWNEQENAPSYFRDKTIYRPFLVSWSGSRMYIGGSAVSHLGYRKGKSYGLTYSTCPDCLAANPALPRPTGTIVDSTFTDMYFGFYSYEADDIAIVNNVYIDNAVYGIDPHDRSRRLIIARNETYGSKKKHGIIVSRNVNDSWIFNNYSHNNHGSGIMIDRASENNVIADNISAYNEGDGITFFESQNNKTYGNRVYRNRLSGVRIRNSWNIQMVDDQITDNGSVPIVLYSMDLAPNQPDRDLKEDPYTQKAGAEVVGTVVKLPDRKPVFKIEDIDNLLLSDIHILSAGKVFADNMLSLRNDVLADAEDLKKVIIVGRSAD